MLTRMLSSFVDLVRLGEPYDVEVDDDPLLVTVDRHDHQCSWAGCPTRAA